VLLLLLQLEHAGRNALVVPIALGRLLYQKQGKLLVMGRSVERSCVEAQTRHVELVADLHCWQPVLKEVQ